MGKSKRKSMKLRQSTTKLAGTMRRPLIIGYMSQHKHHMILTTKIWKRPAYILNICSCTLSTLLVYQSYEWAKIFYQLSPVVLVLYHFGRHVAKCSIKESQHGKLKFNFWIFLITVWIFKGNKDDFFYFFFKKKEKKKNIAY
jgi:hypothetical protein